LSSAEDWTDRWRHLLGETPPAQQEVDAGHPLRLLFGIDTHGRALFLSLSRTRPLQPDIRGVVEASRGQRPVDEKWTLAFTLVDPRFLDVFIDLCSELVVATAKSESEGEALLLLVAAVEGWKDLFVDVPPSTLSHEAVRGLVAELWYGFEVATQTKSAEQVVRGWGGPLGAVRDFSFDDHQIEVKSIHEDSRSVRISSAEQLDYPSGDLSLAVVTLLDVADDTDGAVSISSLAARASSLLATDGRLELNRRLLTSGARFDEDYSHRAFLPTRLRVYGVRPDFPAVRRSELHGSVTAVRYELALSGLDQYLITDRCRTWEPENA